MEENDDLDCANMWTDFAWSGSSNIILFFARDWGSNFCKAVTWPTEYSAMVRDGYKKCICKEFNFYEKIIDFKYSA